MSKTNFAVLAFAAALISSAAQASTLDELVEAQRAALLAAAQKKVDESKPAPVAPVAPVVVQSVGRIEPKREVRDTSLDQVTLIAVYGPLSRLIADIGYKGASFPVRAGDDAIEGWVADSITQSRVVLRKVDSKGKTVRRQTITLSDAAVTSSAASAVQAGAGGYLSGMGSFSQPGGMPSMPIPMPTSMPMPMPVPVQMPSPAPMPAPMASPSGQR